MVRALSWSRELRRLYQSLRDPRVPVWIKALPILAILYWLLPIDLIPDPILVIGWLDDLLIAYALVSQSIRGLRRFADRALPQVRI